MNQHRKSIFIASVILPVLLFATLGFTTISNGNIRIAETRTLETVTWNGTRTGEHFQYFGDSLNSTYIDDEFSVSMRLLVLNYFGPEMLPGYPAWLGLYVEINVSVKAPLGFIYGINVSFHQSDLVDWNVPGLPSTTERPQELVLVQPSKSLVVKTAYEGPNAFMYLLGQNNSRSVSCGAVPQWQFSSNNAIHSLAVDYHITYFNGSAYKVLIQPFQLEVF